MRHTQVERLKKRAIMDTSNQASPVTDFVTSLVPGGADFLRKNRLSRIAHCVLLMAFVVALTLSMVSAVKFGSKHHDISQNSIYGDQAFDEVLAGSCILFADYDDEDRVVDLGPEWICDFAIAGEAVAMVLAAVLIVSSTVKAALGVHM